MSGITPSDTALAAYQDVKLGRNAWGIFGIVNDETVEMHEVGEKKKFSEKNFSEEEFHEAVWAPLTEKLIEDYADKPAYVVVSVCYKDNDRFQNKLALLSWMPDNKVKVKSKMLHGSTMNTTKQAFDGIQGKPVQCGNAGELELPSVISEL